MARSMCGCGARMAGRSCPVHDRGPGIPKEDLPRVFDRYYRASVSNRSEGLGLGLYIAHLIVAAMGGTISVDSTEGEGSTFEISMASA